MGLIFLKPKIAKWRYQRGFRTIMEGLQAPKTDVEMKEESKKEEEEDFEDLEEDQWEILEFIIDYSSSESERRRHSCQMDFS